MKRLDILSYRSSRFIPFLFGLLVVAVGIGLDVLLIDMGAPRRLTLLIDDALTGVAAGCALWLALRQERRHRVEQAHRLEVLDEMNHHVRNALQVLTLCSYTVGGDKGAELTRAVQRIQWSLTEVLPKVNFEAAPPSLNPDFVYRPVRERRDAS